MKFKILLTIFFTILIQSLILGQNGIDSLENINDYSKYSIGIGGAYTIGYNENLYFGPYAEGFTLEYSLNFRYTPNNWGIQISIAPFYNKDISQFVGGISLLYSFIKVKHLNLFVYQGNYYSYTEKHYTIYYLSLDNGVYKTFNNGIGLGVEIVQNDILGLNLMFGYSFYNNFDALRRKGEVIFFYKF